MNADREIQRRVIAGLEWEPSVDPADIGVEVTSGAVTLTGHVRSYAERVAAEKAAKRVYGVRAVANDIKVRLAGSKRDDSDIAAAVSNVLGWSAVVPRDAVKAGVGDGWVTLDGEVEWSYQRDAAERSVRNLSGVTGVTDLIKVKPTVTAANVEAKILDAFRRHAELDARRIWITTHDGTVTLHGHVGSWRELEQAKWAATSAPGVTNVESELQVTP